jgi:hypothetical protein
MAAARAPILPPQPRSRFDARCQLCSRLAGQALDGVFVHHPDCDRVPSVSAGLPRCCDCGGRLYLEPAIGPIPSAADRDAARRSRPSHH